MLMISADVGGTFTDLVLIDSARGTKRVGKVPSARRGSADSVLRGINRILEESGEGAGDVDLFVHGFTVATNAFLMRSGARCLLIVSEGFRDVLEIGDQLRPKLYALQQQKPEPVVPRPMVVAVSERLSAFGEVVLPLQQPEIERVVAAAKAAEPEAIAVCLAFAYLDPRHEEALAVALRAALPDVPLYLSHQVNPQIEEFPRANTTAIAAYVGPITSRYISDLEADLATGGLSAPLLLMQSDGGVATGRAAKENPAKMLLSGPAGGVIAGEALGRRLGIADLVTFDMGGTSADFSAIVAGAPKRVRGRLIDGQPLRLPSLDIETISAGGGSIAWVDPGGALRVGPQSAGSVPGPACYGQGGTEATLTDAALVLGMLAAEDYLDGEVSLTPAAAEAAIKDRLAGPLNLSLTDASLGMIEVASVKMAQAIRGLSIERGLDVRRFALLAFGGAGPLFAPFLARSLGMREVVVPRYPGVFAAEGLLLGDIRHTQQAAWPRRMSAVAEAELADVLTAMRDSLDAQLEADRVAQEDRRFEASCDLRYQGQFHELELPLAMPGEAGWWEADALRREFIAAHEALYGHADPEGALEIVNLRLAGIGALTPPPESMAAAGKQAAPQAEGERPVYLARGADAVSAKLYRRDSLMPGQEIAGPAIVAQRDSTSLILPGQRVEVAPDESLRIRDSE